VLLVVVSVAPALAVCEAEVEAATTGVVELVAAAAVFVVVFVGLLVGVLADALFATLSVGTNYIILVRPALLRLIKTFYFLPGEVVAFFAPALLTVVSFTVCVAVEEASAT
jgi:hypothetical protein